MTKLFPYVLVVTCLVLCVPVAQAYDGLLAPPPAGSDALPAGGYYGAGEAGDIYSFVASTENTQYAGPEVARQRAKEADRQRYLDRRKARSADMKNNIQARQEARELNQASLDWVQ